MLVRDGFDLPHLARFRRSPTFATLQIGRASIARAAGGEFVRWDTPIDGRAGGKETISIDAPLCPVVDDNDNVVFICAERRDVTEKKAQEREIAYTCC
jgi:hypothetical protein